MGVFVTEYNICMAVMVLERVAYGQFKTRMAFPSTNSRLCLFCLRMALQNETVVIGQLPKALMWKDDLPPLFGNYAILMK